MTSENSSHTSLMTKSKKVMEIFTLAARMLTIPQSTNHLEQTTGCVQFLKTVLTEPNREWSSKRVFLDIISYGQTGEIY